MPRPVRLVLVALLPLVAAASVLFLRRRGGFDTPVDTFKTWIAAVGVLAVTGVVAAVAVATPARAGRSVLAFVRGHRRLVGIGFGVVMTVLLLGVLEVAFAAIDSAKPGVKKDQGRLVAVDPVLGYALVPGAETDAVATFGDETIYRTHYSIDGDGHRLTVPAAADAKRAVAFFGCSFTFGEGLADGQTLASQVARRSPSDLCVNLGVPGHGPNHVLARLEDARPLGIPERPAPPAGVYLFMDAHVDRCVGAMYIVNHFGGEAPYYDRRDGRVVRCGDFLHDRPAKSVAYWLLGKSHVLEHFGFNWPPAGRASSVELTADVIVRCAEEFKRRTGSSDFAMAVYPGCKLGRGVAARVGAAGVRVLDYTDLFDPAAPGLSIPHDGHPAAPAIERLAERIAADLRVP